MEQYHSISHSNIQLGNIDFSRDEIAKLSALYVAISKEKYKKEKMEEYLGNIYKYFIPRKNHPVIYKKIIEHKQKNKFKQLYRNKDSNIYDFLENIINQYSEVVDAETIRFMINNFLDNNILSEKEIDIVKRGRNAKVYSHPKNTDIVTYKWATALECLFGYLKLKNEEERIIELIKIIVGE